MIRNCARCGSNFHAAASDRICGSCRSLGQLAAELERPLTPRERQIIQLVGQGKANKDIAAQLYLTTGTVKEYISRIFRKVGVGNRVELALFALKEKTNEPQTA